MVFTITAKPRDDGNSTQNDLVNPDWERYSSLYPVERGHWKPGATYWREQERGPHLSITM